LTFSPLNDEETMTQHQDRDNQFLSSLWETSVKISQTTHQNRTPQELFQVFLTLLVEMARDRRPDGQVSASDLQDVVEEVVNQMRVEEK
jgi:hypothetical protein